MPRPPRPPAPFQLTTPATPMSLNVKHSTMLVLYAIARDHSVPISSAVTTLCVLGATLPPVTPITRYKIRKADPEDPFVSTSLRTTECIWSAKLLNLPSQFSSLSSFVEWAADERSQYVKEYYDNPEVAGQLRSDIVAKAHRVTMGLEKVEQAPAPFHGTAPKRKTTRDREVAGPCPNHTGPECATCGGSGIARMTLREWANHYGVRAPARS